MAKNKTPLLRPLRTKGATMYVFPSATEDIGLNINAGATGVALSNYALLNFTKTNFNYTNVTGIVKDLQNYVMNFETVVRNQSSYNYQEPYTVTENVFWNWISSHGINFKEVSTGSNIYREFKGSTPNYEVSNADRLVQCFGSIDAGNSLSTDFGMFNETYVTIPTSYGNGPVFFRTVDDNDNIKKNVSYRVTTSGRIEGRTASEPGYPGLSTTISTSSYSADNLYEVIKDIPTIKKAFDTLGAGDIEMNSYDDVNVDPNGKLKNIAGYDLVSNEVEFKFNAILLYYSLYDLDDINKQPIATNLFGIVFLNGTDGASGNYLIAPITKKKSYSSQTAGNSYFGNSFSFRINIKTLSVYDNTDAVINDNTSTTSSYSIDFNDVIANLNHAIDVMNTNVQSTMAIQDKYATIVAFYTETQNRLSELETQLDNMLNNRVTEAVNNLTSDIENRFEDIREELNLVDTSGLSSDGTYVGSSALSSKNIIPTRSAVYGGGTSYGNSTDNGSDNGSDAKMLIGETVDIVSSKNANINADKDINITAHDVLFNIKSTDGNQNYENISIIDILHKIAEIDLKLKEYEDVIAANSASVSMLGVPVDDSELDNIDVNDESESIDDENATETLIAAGIIPISGVLAPRAKKPEQPGYYLKENTSGNIVSYVNFNGEEYTETVKCVCGKLYSMNSLLYVFNGETCKLLGQ